MRGASVAVATALLMMALLMAVAANDAADGTAVGTAVGTADGTADGTDQPIYKRDVEWEPQFLKGSNMFSAVGVFGDRLFVTQRGNASLPPVQVVSREHGRWIAGWGSEDIAVAVPGDTWGAHGLSIESCGYACSPGDAYPSARIWIEDFTNYTVKAFTTAGAKQIVLGTPGVPGNGTSPIQFGKVADAFVQGGGARTTPTQLYISDGDGGFANRVSKVSVLADGQQANVRTEWVTGHEFANPHSITLHEKSQLLVVADREHHALKLLQSSDGTILGEWKCAGLDFSIAVPFGVRTLKRGSQDLLFVSSMDNPQDGRNQRIHVIDASSLSAEQGVQSPCSVLQEIAINPHEFSGPHLLGVDHESGDLYAALVAAAPHSAVLKFTPT
eukprot:g4177.t1